MMELFYDLIMVMLIQLVAFVKTHKTVHQKGEFAVCKLSVTKMMMKPVVALLGMMFKAVAICLGIFSLPDASSKHNRIWIIIPSTSSEPFLSRSDRIHKTVPKLTEQTCLIYTCQGMGEG